MCRYSHIWSSPCFVRASGWGLYLRRERREPLRLAIFFGAWRGWVCGFASSSLRSPTSGALLHLRLDMTGTHGLGIASPRRHGVVQGSCGLAVFGFSGPLCTARSAALHPTRATSSSPGVASHTAGLQHPTRSPCIIASCGHCSPHTGAFTFHVCLACIGLR